MKSVMDHNFSQVPAPQIERSVFDRSHGYKTTFDSAFLVPFFIDEILPGDTLNLKATLFGRMSTFIFPVMDNVFLDTFFFYVPNRLVWENWERFNGAQDNPDDSIDFTIPVLDGNDEPLNFGEASLGDYFGLPTLVDIDDADRPNSLPFRAYNLIWNDWFRDQNLQDSVPVPLDDGPDINDGSFDILKRGKRHDYFTSCLPWPQKGDSVTIPLGGFAPVIGDGNVIGVTNTIENMGLQLQDVTGIVAGSTSQYGGVVGAGPGVMIPPLVTRNIGLTTDPLKSGMHADLANATAATINALRQAFQFQKILERDARGGTRYVELLKAHFGVTSPDFRLQRPEYLGGSSQRVDVRGIPQTSETTATTPQGNVAAYSTVTSGVHFNKSFVEHGYIIGLVNVRSDITYQQGMNKLWSRKTRYDFYLPALAHLGEQAVLNKEIFYPNAGTNANLTFGYQERWAEYRYKPSQVTGQFRSNATGTLDSWHLATDFDGIPPLNGTFITDNPPLDRVIAVPGTEEAPEPQIILDSYISMRHARPMPVYSVPGQIDRF